MIRERSCAVKEEKPCNSLEGLNGGSLFRNILLRNTSRGIEQNNEKAGPSVLSIEK